MIFFPTRRRLAKLLVAAAAAAVHLGGASAAQAQFDGSWDPFNKNNKLGSYIETPFQEPSGPKTNNNNNSQLAVQSNDLDADGNFVEVSPNGRRTATGQRGRLLRDAKSGNAFWQYTAPSGQTYTSWAHRYQNQLDQQEAQNLRLLQQPSWIQEEVARRRAAKEAQIQAERRQLDAVMNRNARLFRFGF